MSGLKRPLFFLYNSQLMPKIPCDLQELKDLYLIGNLTLQQIGDKIGVSKQTIHERLRMAGVQLRPRSVRPLDITRETLIDLYVNQKIPPSKIGEMFGLSDGGIRGYLLKHNIPMHPPGAFYIKYPQIREMKIGESLEFPKPAKRQFYGDFYSMAKNAGIRVSVQSIDDKTVRVTRVK